MFKSFAKDDDDIVPAKLKPLDEDAKKEVEEQPDSKKKKKVDTKRIKGKSDIDLVFVVDETGSMGGWINSAKSNILKIIKSVNSDKKVNSLHIGFSTYRDFPPQDSSFVTRVVGLKSTETHLKEIEGFVHTMRASGGGDGPETLIPALYDLVRLNWRDYAAKTAVIITDAPPHGVGGGGDGFPGGDPSGVDWLEQCESLKEMGITVHGVTCGSSGISQDVLEKISSITRGVLLPIGDSSKLTKVICNACVDVVDKDLFDDKVISAIQKCQAGLVALDEEERLDFLFLQLQKKKATRTTMDGKSSKSITRKVEKDDVIESITSIRLRSKLDTINELFPTVGLKDFGQKAGLYNKAKDMLVPLTKIEIDGVIGGDSYLRLEIKQHFFNDGKGAIEAVYRFPVDSRSAIYYFSAEIDGKKIVGKCMEKKKAAEVYEDAIASGSGAYLLEEVGENVFSTSVGNLPSKKSVCITIRVLTELRFVDESLMRVRIPTTLASKFSVPKSIQEFLKKKKGNNEEEGVKLTGVTGCSMQFEFLEGIESVDVGSRHKISVKDKVVRLEDVENGLESDLILFIRPKEKKLCNIVEEKDENGRAVLARTIVKLKEEVPRPFEGPKEIIFVVDCSSSMNFQKPKIKLILKKILSSLKGQKTLFNVICFSSIMQTMFSKGSESVNAENKAHVEEWIKNLNLVGGSEVMSVMEEIETFEKPKEEMERVIFLLTDGNFTNSKKFLEEAKKMKVPFYTIGIGNAINYTVLDKLQNQTNGFTEYSESLSQMKDEEVISSMVERQFRKIYSRLKDVKFEEDTIKHYPMLKNYVFEPIVEGGRLSFFVMEKDQPIVINGKIGKKTVKVVMKMSEEEEEKKGTEIHTLCAKYWVKALGKKEKEVVALATKYNIASSYTSFVAVEERDEMTIEENMKTIEVPTKKAAPHDERKPVPKPVTTTSSSTTTTPKPLHCHHRREASGGKKKKKRKTCAPPPGSGTEERYRSLAPMRRRCEECCECSACYDECEEDCCSFCCAAPSYKKKACALSFSSGVESVSDALDDVDFSSLSKKGDVPMPATTVKKKFGFEYMLVDKWHHMDVKEKLNNDVFVSHFKKNGTFSTSRGEHIVIKVKLALDSTEDDIAKLIKELKDNKSKFTSPFQGCWYLKLFFDTVLFITFSWSQKSQKKLLKVSKKKRVTVKDVIEAMKK